MDGYPVWSPDGTQVAFETQRKGDFDIYVKPSNGMGPAEPLLEETGGQWPNDWSRDGRYLLYYDVSNFGDLRALDLSGGERRSIPVATTPFTEITGAFSPDGRWVAYATNESGRYEVVVQPFPEPTGKWQISSAGGNYPRWRHDGKELYFLNGRQLMAMTVNASDASFEAGIPQMLFEAGFADISPGNYRAPYDVSADGRFLVNLLLEQSSTTPITLILNWRPGKSEVPGQ